MRKLLFVLSLGLLSLFFACGDKSPIQTAVDEYRAGTISEDSLMTFVSDSVRVKETFEWAMQHHQKDDIAAWLLGRAYKYGLGVNRDLIKAKAYYISACKAGNGNAMSGLAAIYMAYPGQENLDSAYYWFGIYILNMTKYINPFSKLQIASFISRKCNNGICGD